jgi:adenylate cyclase
VSGKVLERIKTLVFGDRVHTLLFGLFHLFRHKRRHASLNPDDARGLYVVAQTLAELGRRAESLEWARKMILLAPDDPYILYGMVCILTSLGELDEAVEYFERAVHLGFVQREWIEHDRDLDPIRGHPRFQALVATLT